MDRTHLSETPAGDDRLTNQNRWPAFHGGLLLACLILAGLLGHSPSPGFQTFLGTWPWYLFVPVAAYVGLALAVPPLRRTMPRLPYGRLDRPGAIGAVVLSAATAAVLFGYQRFYHPDVSHLATRLPGVVFDWLVVGGIGFSVVNAVLEELMCRWALYDAIAAEWGVPVAIVATSAFFGFLHMEGYPPGPLGAVLAGLFGVGLALLRWWSGGLALSTGCHVCADAAIFWIICDSR